MVIVSTMGKIEAESRRSGLNQLFQDFRATSRRADGSNNLSSAEGISQLHEVTVKGAKDRAQDGNLGTACALCSDLTAGDDD
jgi:hypothetical protein